METVYLAGSEEAGYSMECAAQEMNKAASYIQDSLQQHQQFLTNWLSNLSNVLERGQNG